MWRIEKGGTMKRQAATAAVTVLVIAVAVAVASWRGGNGASSAGPVPSAGRSGTSASENSGAKLSPAQETPPPTATPATAPSSPKHSLIASTSALPGPELEDGRHFGYLESIDLETPVSTVVFDLAYLLTGEEANQAAAENGYPTPVDNDYYIVNDNPRLRTLLVSPDIRIRLVDWDTPPGSSRRIHDASSTRLPSTAIRSAGTREGSRPTGLRSKAESW
jgi:hypothetical protein